MNHIFPQLKTYTDYSLLEGVGKIKDYVEKAKEYNIKSMAITDNTMFGVIEFYKACVKNDIKPIIGLEIFLDGINISGEYSLTLIAQNNKGYENLSRISTLSFDRVFSRRHKIQLSELKKYSDGLFVLSGGINSEVIKGLQSDNYPEVRETIKYFKNLFKENFYIEVPAQNYLSKVRSNLMEILHEIQWEQYVITNDAYYVNKEDELLQNIVNSIKFGNVLDEKETESVYKDSYIKTVDEIRKSFLSFSDNFFQKGLENTEFIVNNSNVVFDFGILKFPKYDLPDNVSENDFLKKIVWEGVYKKYGSESKSEQIVNRVKYELDIINKMGFSGYFIIVWDFVKYAKENGIYVGPGRGSASGSIVSYVLDITEVDPIRYNLIFERFLNPERVSMPDIDIDFDQEQREKVIDYVVKKYGSDRVAHIITFGTLKARSSMRDVGRVLKVPLPKVDKAAKLVPFNLDLKSSINEIEELKQMYHNDEEIKKMINLSLKLEGNVRHASVHAAGIVISKDPLYKEIPLYSDGRSKSFSTQYQMKELEELGVLKIDFLGLKNLSVLRKTIENIKISYGLDINLQNISLDDEKTYQLMTKGDTLGVFQCESIGIQKLMRKMKIEKFDDIIALLALYRPGPLQSGMVDDFIQVKNGEKKVEYIEETLKDILKETYGLMLYQEQVMQILSVMGGYTLGEADEFRRAIGKKIPEIIYNNREKFIKQSIDRGYTKEKAFEVYSLIEKFGGYGFNKSHSAAYAMIAYWTAYFKANYPTEFFTALMTMEMNNINRLSILINEAKQRGIKTLVPDINKSNIDFTMDDGNIRFGLMAIRDIGISSVKDILDNREKYGNFNNYEMFASRMLLNDINKNKLKALILSGCFDEFTGTRKEKIDKIDDVINWAKKIHKKKEQNWKTLFSSPENRENIEFPLKNENSKNEMQLIDLLNNEKYYLGIYVSKNPLDEYSRYLSVISHEQIKIIYEKYSTEEKLKEYKNTRIIGIVTDVKYIITKKGYPMTRFTVEDMSGEIEVICFPNEFGAFSEIIKVGKKVIVDAEVKKEKNVQLFLRNICELNNIEVHKKLKLCILINDSNYSKRNYLKNLILENKGHSMVEYFIRIKGEKEKKYKDNKNYVRISLPFIMQIIQIMGEKNIKIL